MNKLRCKILKSGDPYMDRFAGLEVLVTKMDLVGYGTCPWNCECVLESDPATPIVNPVSPSGYMEIKKGHVFKCCATVDVLDPIDKSMVPETHNGSMRLQQIWIFHTAGCDAWFRFEYPEDLNGRKITQEAFVELYGKPWKDERIFEMERRRG